MYAYYGIGFYKIIIVIVIFIILLYIYKKVYRNYLNRKLVDSKKGVKLPEYRRLFQITSIIVSLLIVISMYSIYKNNFYGGSTTLGQLKLISKKVCYERDKVCEGYYVTFEFQIEGHNELVGGLDTITVKLDKGFDNFAFRSLVLGEDYLVTFAYRGNYEDFLSAYQDDKVYLQDALSHYENHCKRYEGYKECSLSNYNQ